MRRTRRTGCSSAPAAPHAGACCCPRLFSRQVTSLLSDISAPVLVAIWLHSQEDSRLHGSAAGIAGMCGTAGGVSQARLAAPAGNFVLVGMGFTIVDSPRVHPPVRNELPVHRPRRRHVEPHCAAGPGGNDSAGHRPADRLRRGRLVALEWRETTGRTVVVRCREGEPAARPAPQPEMVPVRIAQCSCTRARATR